MTQARKVQWITLVVLAGALAIAVARREATRSLPTTPQDAIYRMLDAARNGNVPAYLASYTGPLEQSLEASARESTEPRFAAYLKDSNAAIKGVALGDPQPVNDRQSTVRIEYVYQDRNEAQVMLLEKTGEQWKIARVDGTEPVKTLVPYGTPVR